MNAVITALVLLLAAPTAIYAADSEAPREKTGSAIGTTMAAELGNR
jgi:hypothetical protein